MPTQTQSKRKTALPLENGDRMKQPEFHRRYLHHEGVKIELIGGVVHMPSPTRGPHGLYISEINLVLALYKAVTPGVEVADNITAILSDDSEPQPDLLMRLHHEYGGCSQYNEDSYLVGPPELVVEVAHSTQAIDLHTKRNDYLAADVQEYLVYCVEEQEIHWSHFPSKRRLKPNKDGIWKSRVFPGLWLHNDALIERNSPLLIATVQQGLASEEHADFVKRLQARAERSSEQAT